MGGWVDGRCRHHGRHVDVQPAVGECRQVGGGRVRSVESEAPVPGGRAAPRRTARARHRPGRQRARDRAGGSCPSRTSDWTGCGRRGDPRSPRSSTRHARGARGRCGSRGSARSWRERSRRRRTSGHEPSGVLQSVRGGAPRQALQVRYLTPRRKCLPTSVVIRRSDYDLGGSDGRGNGHRGALPVGRERPSSNAPASTT